jgi:hypothetical protein
MGKGNCAIAPSHRNHRDVLSIQCNFTRSTLALKMVVLEDFGFSKASENLLILCMLRFGP